MTNLNLPHQLLYRRWNQRARRLFFSIFQGRRQALWDERRRIVAVPTRPDVKRLRQVAWTLGEGSLYRFTEEQAVLMRKLAEEIVAEYELDQ